MAVSVIAVGGQSLWASPQWLVSPRLGLVLTASNARRHAIRPGQQATAVEEQEPRLLAFNQWESEDHTPSVVIQVHPDAESFEYHLKLFGERVKQTFDYIDLEAVEIYGPPNPFVEQFISHGLEGLPVTTHPRRTHGFTRLPGA